ncbi:MAG TPA: hypothetical protein VFA59_04890 [Vicinamibacterales bacterium]|nr:hypothetical protein [Vicinamibacterales bacterium]
MTTRQFLSCTAAACLMSAGLLAQTQTPPPKTAPEQVPSSNTNRVTVSGCVERADQLQSASATTTVDSLSFVLIKPTVEKPIATSGSSEITADPKSPTSDRMYRLDAPVEQLNLHVGHKVEVTGTIADNATAPAGAGSTTNAPRLKVESVKMVDATCPR